VGTEGGGVKAGIPVDSLRAFYNFSRKLEWGLEGGGALYHRKNRQEKKKQKLILRKKEWKTPTKESVTRKKGSVEIGAGKKG